MGFLSLSAFQPFSHSLFKFSADHLLLRFYAVRVIDFFFFIGPVAFVAFPFDIDTTGTTFAPRTSSIGRREETRVVAEEISRFNPYVFPPSIIHRPPPH